MAKTILLVTHEETVATDYGYMAGYLEELGHTVIHHSVLDATPGHDGFLPANVDFPSLDGIDSVIIFGSFTHAYDERTRAWVEKEMDFIREIRDRGTPFLGICFGAQLLAEVLGGKTVKAPALEAGMISFTTTASCPAPLGNARLRPCVARTLAVSAAVSAGEHVTAGLSCVVVQEKTSFRRRVMRVAAARSRRRAARRTPSRG